MTNFQPGYLTFSLGIEEYAVPLLSVKEVIAVPEITPIPSAPTHFLGVMNLRGQVISIIDLRLKLGIKPTTGSETAVIICTLETIVIGMIVDSINSVLTPKPEQISTQPEIQNIRKINYVTGIYQTDKKLVLIIDVIKALDLEEIQASAQKKDHKSSKLIA